VVLSVLNRNKHHLLVCPMPLNPPVICVPICEQTISDAEQAIIRAAPLADLIEIRFDCLSPSQIGEDFHHLDHLFKNSPKPTIITYRPAEQGGRQELNMGARVGFWWFNRPANDGLFDIEFDLASNKSVFDSVRQPDWSRVICSYHDFIGMPRDLDGLYNRMVETPARILKIAVQAHDAIDCLPVFRLLERALEDKREMIAIAMGSSGIATRILGPSRGAFLTYAALESETGTAPGQLTAWELKQVYRIEKIDRQTQIFGLMGLPVLHSVSPLMHNAAFETMHMNAVYLPFEVKNVSEFIRRMIHPRTRELDWNLGGLSVTAPHKQAVMEHLDWIDPAAEGIGAVNTIAVVDGELHGYNTDARGLVEPLVLKFGELRAARCAVMGAGGAARAALWGLRQDGAEVTVFARNPKKAEALASEFDATWGTLEQDSFDGYDIVINTTPLGTVGPHESQTPASAVQLRGARLAYDLVYNPIETQFLREAREAGCETLGGLSMLIAQAVEQFKIWTSRDAPDGMMREAAERGLRSGISDGKFKI
jgi:3-dehydroquinate dehydratase/shikimate dehydrogenase